MLLEVGPHFRVGMQASLTSPKVKFRTEISELPKTASSADALANRAIAWTRSVATTEDPNHTTGPVTVIIGMDVLALRLNARAGTGRVRLGEQPMSLDGARAMADCLRC
jgi:hypothetical protein